MPAVLAQVVPAHVVGPPLVDPVRFDQSQKRLARQPELVDGRLQRLQDRPLRVALVAGPDLALELVEGGESIPLDLVTQDVDEAGEAVDRAEMRSQARIVGCNARITAQVGSPS